jgi:Flp pilus assembly protein CpaB
MKNKNLIIIASAIGIIGILGIVFLKRRKMQEENTEKMTPEQMEAAKSLASSISSGTFKLR